jgi:tetratricopeptide (TPR) repeat protein
MSSESKPAAAIELFYSYSHKDERLCELLATHLKALQRSGLIRSWYDRRIDPGAAWSEQIQRAMERAGIILLLISPDFIASDYCYEIELPFAMKRHESGESVVIPILLRPVLYQDAPFAKLQMLPKDARPIIQWGRRDEAFNDIAAAIRCVIIEKRLHPDAATSKESASQERVLDAAVPAEVRVNEPADVVALIRLPDSKGLRAVLASDDSYSVSPEDVKSSEAFELEFPRDEHGKPLPVSIHFELQAPGFDPPKQIQEVRIMPKGDSPVCVFMLTPQREGRLALVLNVLAEGQLIASRRLVTTAVSESASAAIGSPTPYKVVEMPLRTKGPSTRPSEDIGPTGPHARLASGGGGCGGYESEMKFDWETTAKAPAPVGLPPAMPQSYPSAPMPELPAHSMARGRRSKLPLLALGAVAAAAILFIPAVWRKNKPTTPTSVSTSQLDETIATLSRQIEQNPTNAELYVRRALAYERANNLEAAKQDVDQAIRLAPENPTAQRLRTHLLEEQDRRRAASRAPH